jgi:ABC-type transporter Mla subunit MlaD
MPYSEQTADQIGGILDELANALTAVEARQNELDKPALELVQLVGVDVQDISDTLAARPASDLFDPAGELAEITAWLAAHRTDLPDLVTELTTLTGTAAAKISDLAGS